MKLIILGSGVFLPNLQRNSPGYLLELASQHILVDCGSGALLQLEKVRKGLYQEIDGVFITHTHTDHICDIAALLHALRWNDQPPRKKKILLAGPPGITTFFERHWKPVLGEHFQGFPLVVQEITGTAVFPGFSVESCKTKHSEDSQAYKFTADKKSIIFSGDMGYDERFIRFAKGTDVLILECTLNVKDKEGWEGHLRAEQCAEIAVKADCKRLILSHLQQDEEDNRKKLEIVKRTFPQVALAQDLMQVEI